MTRQKRLVIISGLSGAGKSVVLNALEDWSFYCMDTLPVKMLMHCIAHLNDPLWLSANDIAIAIDARNTASSFSEIPRLIEEAKKLFSSVTLVFLEADSTTLIQRFSRTRRKHPLSSQHVSLAGAIEAERRLLGHVSEAADLRIDTSHRSVRELQQQVAELIVGRETCDITLQLTSFGYKYGVPRDADLMFDARFLPNPFWEEKLRQFTGLDQEVSAFLSASPKVVEFQETVHRVLSSWIVEFERSMHRYLNIAFGCTGGQHRSVYLVERFAVRLRASGKQIIIMHRDIHK